MNLLSAAQLADFLSSRGVPGISQQHESQSICLPKFRISSAKADDWMLTVPFDLQSFAEVVVLRVVYQRVVNYYAKGRKCGEQTLLA